MSARSMRAARPAAVAAALTVVVGVGVADAAVAPRQPAASTPLAAPAGGVSGRISLAEPGRQANLRSGPGTAYEKVGTVTHGAVVEVACTTSSERVDGPRWPSTLWNRLSNGSWVSHALVVARSGELRPAPECRPTGLRPRGDDYPYRRNLNVDDRWWMTPGQCTSFVAWRMEQLGGYFHNRMWHHGVAGRWGDARDWDSNARRLRYTVDRTPRVGAIAQWEPGRHGAGRSGHVAYIAGVSRGGRSVTVHEYNWTVDRGFGVRVVPTSRISNVIHLVPGT